MIDIIKRYPEMIADAIQKTRAAQLPKYTGGINRIIVCGMGGSAIGGDILRCLLRDKLKAPIEVSRSYHLPAYADKHTLVLCNSYSGNTEETLSQFADAIRANCKIISIISGGKLEEWSKKLGKPVVKIPSGFQPRAALPYLFFPMLTYIIDTFELNLEYSMDGDARDIKQMIENVDLSMLDYIAKQLVNKQVAIYASDAYEAVAMRAKTQLNENSKTHARFAVFPELDHNEIVGYQSNVLNKDLVVVILRDKEEAEEIKARIEATKDIIGGKVKIIEIWSEGSNTLEKTVSLLYKTDYISVKLAEIYKIDPEPVASIEILKKQLKERTNFVEKLEEKLF